jgi:hypothetical protein
MRRSTVHSRRGRLRCLRPAARPSIWDGRTARQTEAEASSLQIELDAFDGALALIRKYIIEKLPL